MIMMTFVDKFSFISCFSCCHVLLLLEKIHDLNDNKSLYLENFSICLNFFFFVHIFVRLNLTAVTVEKFMNLYFQKLVKV